jgi:hypothetical protein
MFQHFRNLLSFAASSDGTVELKNRATGEKQSLNVEGVFVKLNVKGIPHAFG